LLWPGQAKAEEETWYLKVTVAEATQYLPMSQVGSLVGIDASQMLAVLDYEGRTLAEGVTEAQFVKVDPMSVPTLSGQTAQPTLLKGVGRQITIIGATADITVYNAGGSVVTCQQPANGETVIDVSRLPSGTYLVRTGQQTFKFIKK
jgi:hypothetical protein